MIELIGVARFPSSPIGAINARVDNGLLLRSDVHTLFDKGYLTITPEYRLRVSRRLKKDFDNGEHYCELEGNVVWTPPRTEDKPNQRFFEWHADSVFLG